ncbi:hypothetical protein [Ulvibacterium sp.]|uniref:hypothetical protein n=1 Tax=Ulvibacterium sp. TaxID=2665914 RepID=UPI003BAD679C
MKKTYLVLFGLLSVISSCSSDGEGGNCSISCGGFGTGQPFVQTNKAFVSESECVQLGKDKDDASCKTSFCPPTGDPYDCYQVYP